MNYESRVRVFALTVVVMTTLDLYEVYSQFVSNQPITVTLIVTAVKIVFGVLVVAGAFLKRQWLIVSVFVYFLAGATITVLYWNAQDRLNIGLIWCAIILVFAYLILKMVKGYQASFGE
jgi:hypothetical protein